MRSHQTTSAPSAAFSAPSAAAPTSFPAAPDAPESSHPHPHPFRLGLRSARDPHQPAKSSPVVGRVLRRRCVLSDRSVQALQPLQPIQSHPFRALVSLTFEAEHDWRRRKDFIANTKNTADACMHALCCVLISKYCTLYQDAAKFRSNTTVIMLFFYWGVEFSSEFGLVDELHGGYVLKIYIFSHLFWGLY